MARRPSPPNLPLRNFETNANRVRALIGEVHPAVPPRSRLQSDVAAAVIVMTLSAADTYFGDRFAADFGLRFDAFDEAALGDILASVFQGGADGFERRKFARALQHSEPKGEVVRMYRAHTDLQTYQEPGVIKEEAKRFGVRNLWGDVDYRWRGKYGTAVKSEARFRDWADRRHAIAHRAGRSRKDERPRRTAEHVSGDEARDCVNFFARLIGLVDYHLNDELHDRQPRRRDSEIAIFDLEAVSSRRSFVPPRRRKVPDASSI